MTRRLGDSRLGDTLWSIRGQRGFGSENWITKREWEDGYQINSPRQLLETGLAVGEIFTPWIVGGEWHWFCVMRTFLLCGGWSGVELGVRVRTP